ncbi:MAG: multicopper oxidase domain-containing protein [Gemmatimonadales bacterium]
MSNRNVSRRDALRAGALGTVGLAAGAGGLSLQALGQGGAPQSPTHGSHHDMVTVGQLAPGSFDPTAFLTRFEGGNVSRLPSGQVLREFELVAEDREIEVAPGVFFPAWTYNGQVPGPTIRVTEGDRLRVHFRNEGSHAHSIHFHGIHPSGMDGAFEPVHPGRS